MSTPLKALLQERLRAKIVRQGDEDDIVAGDGLAPALIDPSEYLTPSPHAVPRESRQRGYTTTVRQPNHRRARTPSDPLAFDDELRQLHDHKYAYRSSRDRDMGEQDLEVDTAWCRSDTHREVGGRGETRAFRDTSPPPAFTGSKRQWSESRGERPMAVDDEPSFHHKRPARERRAVSQQRQQHSPSPPPVPAMPRKNYDLSSAYQRYRELSSKRGNARLMRSFVPQEDTRNEYGDISASWSSSELTRSVRPFGFDDEYGTRSRWDESHAKPVARRSARWLSPTQSKTRSTTPLDDTLKVGALYENKLNEAARCDGYPVEHVSPTYQAAVLSPRVGTFERREATSCFSTRLYDPYSVPRIHESENRIVFRTATRAMSAPRSPSKRQFIRHETATEDTSVGTFLDRADSFDSKLSPESHQAAKEFVEKRQKRSSQGTPRTMATQRWLQSMVDARLEVREVGPEARRTPSPSVSSESQRQETRGRIAHDDPVIKSKGSHIHHRDATHSIHEPGLSPVYSPPRYASGAAVFFSSAV